jgi:hypothetical protein
VKDRTAEMGKLAIFGHEYFCGFSYVFGKALGSLTPHPGPLLIERRGGTFESLLTVWMQFSG